jgi:hypothetical protein
MPIIPVPADDINIVYTVLVRCIAERRRLFGVNTDYSGLRDVWVESGVYGENTTSHMLIGHAYNKAICGHKLTYEAL